MCLCMVLCRGFCQEGFVLGRFCPGVLVGGVLSRELCPDTLFKMLLNVASN